MNEKKMTFWDDSLLASVPALVTVGLSRFHNLDWMLQLLILLAGANALAGGANAVAKKKFSLDKMRRGGMKRLGIALLVALFAYIDFATGRRFPLDDAVAAFFCSHEGIGMLRNLRSLGVPIPPVVTEWLAMLEEKGRPNPAT